MLLLLLLLLLRLFSLPAVDLASAQDVTLVHSGAFTQQLNLVGSDGSIQQLSLTDDDVQYLGITVDESNGDVYFATSNGTIQRARYDTTQSTSWDVTTVIAGHVEVHVEGYNLGASVDDIVFFSVRGVECLTMRRESSNSISCVFGHEIIASDLGEGIGTGDVAIQTAVGGWTQGGYVGDFLDAKLADHSLKPIITRVGTTGRTITPRAVCFDSTHSRLYYSDLGARSVNRIALAGDGGSDGDTSDQAVTVEFDAFLSDIIVHGMAVDTNEGQNDGFLYLSDSQNGQISKVELPVDGGGGPGAPQVLVSGLIDPMGVALEPSGGGNRIFFTLRGGSIRAATRDGSVSHAVQRSANLDGGGYEVRRLDSGTYLDGIAISETEGTGTDPTELRLYWSESGHAPGIKRASLDGTRPESVSVLDGDEDAGGEKRQLVWPRGLAFGAGPSTGLLFCDFLGSIQRLPYPAGGLAEKIVEADSYPAAVAIRTLVAVAGREGVKEAFATQSVRF